MGRDAGARLVRFEPLRERLHVELVQRPPAPRWAARFAAPGSAPPHPRRAERDARGAVVGIPSRRPSCPAVQALGGCQRGRGRRGQGVASSQGPSPPGASCALRRFGNCWKHSSSPKERTGTRPALEGSPRASRRATAASSPVFQGQFDKALLIPDLQIGSLGFASSASRAPPTARTVTWPPPGWDNR